MNIVFLKIGMMAMLLLADSSFGIENIIRADQIPHLHEDVHHPTVSKRVTLRFTRSHYRTFDLNQDFSAKIFNRYLNLIDYNHNVLLASDISQYNEKKTILGDALYNGKLNVFYDLYNLMQKRRFELYQYALNILNCPIDFTGNETIEIDRTKLPWPKSTKELNALWNDKVKYDELNLKLIGKDDKKIRDTLTKRYQFAIRRLTQSNSEDVFQLAMTAFAHEIDPHTSYLSPHNTEQFNTEMSLSLEGIGAVLKMDNDYTVIKSMMAGGPAAKSKMINVGDRIVGVGQPNKPIEDVIGLRLDDVVSKIKGPRGSKISLEILPVGKGTKTLTVTLMREKILLQEGAVKGTVHNIGTNKVGVLDIPGFYIGLTDNVKVQLQKLHKQHIKSLVIDLRNNGGGSLTESISLSGMFIPSGPVVQVRDNNNHVLEDSYNEDIVYKGPLVVLVDRLSASASEIFAAAMQDYGRALIVGEPTFGKGTVQQYHSLNRVYDQILHPAWPTLGSVQYTVQKFYRINGGSTQRKGVVPDILMPSIKFQKIGEKFEDNALPWDSIDAAIYTKTGDIVPLISSLTKKHYARIAKNLEFQCFINKIKGFNVIKNKSNIVSLNLIQRLKENHEEDELLLECINAHYKAEGKAYLKKLNDVPKDYKEPDLYLDEAIKIANNMSHMEKLTLR